VYVPVQHNGIVIVLVASLGLQVIEHRGLTTEHCIARDCETILVVPHDGTTGDHVDQGSEMDTTSVGRKNKLLAGTSMQQYYLRNGL